MGQVPYQSYAATEAHAERFLAKYDPSDTIPVPIEMIVEHELHLDIVPVPGLFRRVGVTGFLSNDCQEIFVDQFDFERHEARYRFTLAHEVGHLVLHGTFYREAKIRSSADFLRFREAILAEDLERLEIQAMNFAGAVLMPRGPLQALLASFGVSRADLVKLGSAVARRFFVSTGAADRRMRLSGLLRI